MKKTLTAMMLAMTAMAYAQTDTMKGADDMAQQAENQMAKKPMMQDDMAKKEMKDDMKGHDTMYKDGMMKDEMKGHDAMHKDGMMKDEMKGHDTMHKDGMMKDDMKGHDAMHKDGMMKDDMKDDTMKKHKKAKGNK